jgi:cytochrome c553
MQAYKDNQRTGGMAAVMTGQAKNLSEQDIADLAAFYAAMK